MNGLGAYGAHHAFHQNLRYVQQTERNGDVLGNDAAIGAGIDDEAERTLTVDRGIDGEVIGGVLASRNFHSIVRRHSGIRGTVRRNTLGSRERCRK